jgi:hypothetical protein
VPYLYSTMKGSIPCRCDRGERQRVETEYASLMGRQAKTVSHLPSCPIVEGYRLREVEKKLDKLGEQMSLPDPILEEADSAKRVELEAERKRLRKRLDRYLDKSER